MLRKDKTKEEICTPLTSASERHHLKQRSLRFDCHGLAACSQAWDGADKSVGQGCAQIYIFGCANNII